MADSNIRISLELADAAAQKSLTDFITKAVSADKATEKLGETSKGTFSEIALHIGKATGAYEIFAGNIAANLAIKAIEVMTEAAHKLFDTFIVEGVKAAEENQNAINSLNVALAASGKFTQETSKDFQEFAAELQKNSTFSHDLILQNAALIESFTQLDVNGLKRATQAAVDLAAATGKDLPAASLLLSKAAEGNVTALHKLGIEVKVGRDNAETFSSALTQIESHFGGAAESKLNTYSGAVAATGNSFKELIEQVGNFIVKNPAVIDTVKEAGKIFSEIALHIEENSAAYAKLVGEGLSIFLTTSAALVTALDVQVRIWQTVYGAIQALTIPVGIVTVGIRSLSVGFTQASKEFEDFSASALKNLTAFGKGGDGALSGVATNLLRMRDAADKGLDALAKGADGSVDPVNKSGGAVKALSAEMKAAEDHAKSFSLSLINAGVEGKKANSEAVALAKASMEAQIAVDAQLFAQKDINEIEYLKRKSLAEKAFGETQRLSAIDELGKQNALVDFAFDHLKISEKEYYAAKKQLMTQFDVTRAKDDQQTIQRDAKTKQELANAERRLAQDRMTTLTGLAALQNSKNREMFEIGKAANIAEIAINTYTGAIKAYNSLAGIPYVGPFLGAAAAAAITAYGLEQEANAASTQFAYEQGGIVPGNSFSGDNITARVNSGEMILNRQQQSNLFDIAQRGGGADNSKIEALLSHLIQTIKATPVQVQVGGRTIVDTLRSELQSGRTFA